MARTAFEHPDNVLIRHRRVFSLRDVLVPTSEAEIGVGLLAPRLDQTGQTKSCSKNYGCGKDDEGQREDSCSHYLQ
jgi:hypothetical protein